LFSAQINNTNLSLVALPAGDKLDTNPSTSQNQSQLRKPECWSTLLVSSLSSWQSLTITHHVCESAQAPYSAHDTSSPRVVQSSNQDRRYGLGLVLDEIRMCSLRAVEAERLVIGAFGGCVCRWVGYLCQLAVFACVGRVNCSEPEGGCCCEDGVARISGLA